MYTCPCTPCRGPICASQSASQSGCRAVLVFRRCHRNRSRAWRSAGRTAKVHPASNWAWCCSRARGLSGPSIHRGFGYPRTGLAARVRARVRACVAACTHSRICQCKHPRHISSVRSRHTRPIYLRARCMRRPGWPSRPHTAPRSLSPRSHRPCRPRSQQPCRRRTRIAPTEPSTSERRPTAQHARTKRVSSPPAIPRADGRTACRS